MKCNKFCKNCKDVISTNSEFVEKLDLIKVDKEKDE